MSYDVSNPDVIALMGQTDDALKRAGMQPDAIAELRKAQRAAPPDNLTAEEWQAVKDGIKARKADPLADLVKSVQPAAKAAPKADTK